MSKLDVKKVIIFKHGVSYFILEGKQKGTSVFELEFKIDEMNDILKSLFVLDTSEKGYISSISYDAALDTSQLLKSIMLNVPDRDSFSSLVTQIKGAQVNLTIGTSKKVSGTIMGIEFVEKSNKEGKITEKLLTLLRNDAVIVKIPFPEITSFEIVNEDLKKDLKFFLDTIIAGKKKDAKKIKINCESGGDDAVERNIIVSFIRESPVWKTSYRLIMSKQQALEEKCLLSGWCMVENTTNQDWEDIELSLVAGMPVSFIYDFYRPIFIDRPRIQPPRVLSARPTEIEDGLEREKFDKDAETKKVGGRGKKKMKDRAPKLSMARTVSASTMVPMSEPVMTGDLDDSGLMEKMKSQTMTSTKDLGELFEYNIANLVSIKRKHSALVPILTEEIKARKILLYNKNEHDKNPNACLEITNNTNLTLERGPVTIIYDNNLAGEAIIPFLNKEDTRLLNYAVEQAVIITYEQKSENLKIHKVSVSGAYCYEYYFTNMFTFYKIKNKTNEEKILYLDHPKTSGYKIKESPIEPEETPNYWRFKITLKPKDAIKFDIKEQYENSSSYYLWNWNKDNFLKKVSFYIERKFIDEKMEAELKELAKKIGEVNEITEKKSKLEEERYQMSDEQSRIRENIRVLGTSTQESSLREKYVKKFSEQEEKFEQITAEIKELEEKIKVMNKEIEDKMNKLRYN
jgi:hypothetical protein